MTRTERLERERERETISLGDFVHLTALCVKSGSLALFHLAGRGIFLCPIYLMELTVALLLFLACLALASGLMVIAAIVCIVLRAC